MAIVHQFSYARPSTVVEVLSLLALHGERATIMAGGTDVVVHLKEGRLVPECVIDVKDLAGFRRIAVSDDRLEIAAGVTFSDILCSPEVRDGFPLIAESAATVASTGIRNRATLAGNLCSAVPSLDCGPAVLVHDAHVHLASARGERNVSIHQWFTGPKQTARRPDELVVSVTVPRPQRRHAGCYVKLGRYRGEDLAQAGVAVMALEDKTYRVAFCALGPIPARAHTIEELLAGRELDEETLTRAKAAVDGEIAPISDIRASQAYRRHMAALMLERGLLEAARRLRGEPPAMALLGG
ncbi:xanthine dehydrogenase family protein subunit M [Candidatus Fermentibacteria bacterium]|nr:xanthine dehydrogenase family protein subunit M [Candidatus Fermentibacteria bacterium]